jgi:D-alanyl-D-alanine carboxypeptidase/D-alanyl-D-alanine-endopeptidase (penicillin-binding protein 4)
VLLRRQLRAAVVGVLCTALPSLASDPADTPRLVWHAETADGRVVASRDADEPVNPASVVKLATTLWALERLGPDYRYATVFAARGEIDEATGVLDGDLLVLGMGDPDFHVENGFLVADALNRLGLREVRGTLRLERFWIGWEGGQEGRERDAGKRRALMTGRLMRAFDPDRWDEATWRDVGAFLERRGETDRPWFPRIKVHGTAGLRPEAGTRPLLTHRANPLRTTLKRLNAYSNNDIERLAALLGPAEDLTSFFAERAGAEETAPSFATLSGLGQNRASPRQMVHLVRDLATTCERLDLRLEDVLPKPGCDPGTLKHFPKLQQGGVSRAVTAKTGTLLSTDGGVSVLAGRVETAKGPVHFAVAAPRNGAAVDRARRAKEAWLIELIEREGGPAPGSCGAPVVFSDHDAKVEVAPGRPQ